MEPHARRRMVFHRFLNRKPLGTTSKPNCRLTAGSVRFRAVSIVLNNDNRLEPDRTGGRPALGFEATP